MSPDPAHTVYTELESPHGPLLVAGNGRGLVQISFLAGTHPRPAQPGWSRDDDALREAVRQLRDYFGGGRREFDLPLDPIGTHFQRMVWAALCTIPFGSTISYGELARRLGKPSASRAVGAANGRNPLPVVVPCHRVIGADGSLTGYGEGLPIKEALLRMEGALPQARLV